MPRLKKKWMEPKPESKVFPIQNPCETPAHPNVVQAARHFGFPDPESRGAQAFRRWAKKLGAKVVRLGKRDTWDLKQLEQLWQNQVSAA